MSSGRHWSCQDGEFAIFGRKGRIDKGGKWILPVETPRGGFYPMDPAPISTRLREVIQDAIHDGNGGRISYIGVGPFQALLLALEGVITEGRLRNAKETNSQIVLSIMLDKVERTLVILREPVYTVATYDSDDASV